MIIGRGLIATSLEKLNTEGIVYFASGVSNSLETKNSEFERELSLLTESIHHHKDCRLVYFSTLSVNDQSKKDSPYVLHKLKMEDFIRENSQDYLILRIGNIVGKGGNPNTLFNFLKSRISGGLPFVLHKKAKRTLVDIDDIPQFFNSECRHLSNQTIDFSYPYHYSLNEIIEAMQKKLGQKAIYEENDEGDFYTVDFSSSVSRYYSGTDAGNYLERLIAKYL